MLALSFGVLLLTGIHLFLSLSPATAAALRAKHEGLLKLLITAGAGGGIALIVYGWSDADRSLLYLLPAPLQSLGFLLAAIGIYLFVVSGRPSHIKRWLRHPQLTGLASWSVGHLLLNGDPRSLVLFGGLLAWALASIVLINRRDGSWEKDTPPPGLRKDVFTFLVALIVIVVVIKAHPWLAGVPAASVTFL